MSKYGVFSGPYFPVFSPNAGKYGPEKSPDLGTFHTVNFILHETVLCDDRNPPWFNNKIKSLMRDKNTTFKRFRRDRRNICLRKQSNCLQDRLNDSTEASKQKYYCKMNNKLTNVEKVQKLTGQY